MMKIYLVKQDVDEEYSTVIKGFFTKKAAEAFIKKKIAKETKERERFYRCEGKCYNCYFSTYFVPQDMEDVKNPKCLKREGLGMSVWSDQKGNLIAEEMKVYKCANKKFPYKPSNFNYSIEKIEVKDE